MPLITGRSGRLAGAAALALALLLSGCSEEPADDPAADTAAETQAFCDQIGEVEDAATVGEAKQRMASVVPPFSMPEPAREGYAALQSLIGDLPDDTDGAALQRQLTDRMTSDPAFGASLSSFTTWVTENCTPATPAN